MRRSLGLIHRGLINILTACVLISFGTPVLQARQLNHSYAATNQSAQSDQFDNVRGLIREAMDKEGIPSISVAVAKGGKIVWEESFGWANREKMIPANPNTMYSMASISKPYTAVGMMRLVEEGKVDLDKPINDYLGVGKLTGYAADASGATVRRVMSHTSGLPLHYQFFYKTDDYTAPTMDETIARYGIVVNPPGEVYMYSNLGYGIIDYAESRVSGMNYADYMRTKVFLPLGLTHTSVGIGPGLEAYAAERYDSKQRPIPFYTFDHVGASAIYCSAHDLVRFGMFNLKDHLAGQQQIIKDSTMDLMQKSATPSGSDEGYGLGWGISQEFGYRVVSHTGGMPGVATSLTMFPSEDMAIVVLSNSSNITVERIAQYIAAAMLPKYAEAMSKAPEQKKQPLDSFEPFKGEWTGTLRTWQQSIPLTLTVKADGDIHVKLGDELETVLNVDTLHENHLIGFFAGNVPTPDASRHAHRVGLDIRLRNGKLEGYAAAMSTDNPIHFALSSYVQLTRKAE